MSMVFIIAGRVVAIATVLFFGAFALDAFSPDVPLGQNLLGLFIHLLPSLVLLALVAVSWRWPFAGGVLFLIAALAPPFLLSNPFWVNLMLATPPALAGILLVIGGLLIRQG